MRYPNGDEAGRQLFFDLAKRAEQDRYDDEFLQMLIEYREMYPSSEHFDLFYGRYAAFHGNHKVALEYAQKAYRKRKVNLEVWKLLAKCYEALGQPEKAMQFRAYCCNFYEQPLQMSIPRSKIDQNLGMLSVAMGRGNYAPLSENKMFFGADGALEARRTAFGGEYLPVPADTEGYLYWVGVYNELAGQGSRGKLLERELSTADAGFFDSDDFVYDIMRSRVGREMTVNPEGAPVVVPVAAATGAAMKERVDFQSDGLAESACVGQWEYSFFRVDRCTHISADHPLVFGRPVPLRHSAGRRRIVLNILVDALCWNVFRQDRYQCMPHIMEFFEKGIVFDQHFSVSEYTYPSLPTIETGMYPHHSQVFNERAALPLDEEYVTLSERMKDLGYYCVNVMGSGDAVYNGVTRGYDRMIVNFCDLSAYAGVERTIRQMEAFSECDQFVFLHLGEVHPWPAGSLPFPLETQTRLSLRERLSGTGKSQVSVYLPDAHVYQDANRRSMIHVDRSLRGLFDYLVGHYDEDEYIVQLYSDHGVSIYDPGTDILGNNQTGAAWMLRGSGVPALGLVEELTSAVDIYPTLAKLAGFPVGDYVDGNLPAAFGGKKRECVFSNSMFPGQTYKLCIRTEEHECYLESMEPVDEDGTVDLSGAEMVVRMRNGNQQAVGDPSLDRYFLNLAEEYTSSFHHGGRHWKSMREARPEWFHEKAGRLGL